MRCLILLCLLLIAAPAYAGPEFLACVGTPCKAQTGTVNSINGVTFLDIGDVSDTGTATPSTYPLCSGNITVNASCQGGTSGTASVHLVVNGVERASLSCGIGVNNSATIGATNVSSRYSVRVYIQTANGGLAQADTFSLPVAQ